MLQVFQRDSEILRIEAARSLTISAPTAAKALATLEAHSIVREITGQQYRKLYAYQQHLDVLNEDTL